MKEIVIKIPDEVKKAFDNAENNELKGGFYDHGGVIASAIRNGTELPKGHERLIEVTPRLEMYLSTFQSYTGIDEAPYEYANELIRNADTVVEADKGE